MRPLEVNPEYGKATVNTGGVWSEYVSYQRYSFPRPWLTDF
jgi:hypothetical protein